MSSTLGVVLSSDPKLRISDPISPKEDATSVHWWSDNVLSSELTVCPREAVATGNTRSLNHLMPCGSKTGRISILYILQATDGFMPLIFIFLLILFFHFSKAD